MVMVLLAATWVTLGAPSIALADQFLIQGNPTPEAAVAIVSILCWMVIGVIALATVIAAARSSSTDAQVMMRRWTRAVMLVLAGVMVLGMGAVRHATSGYSMCTSCGQQSTHIAEVEHLVSGG